MNLFGPHGPARVAEIFLPSRPRTEAPPGERADSGPMRLETLHYSPGDRDWRVIVKHRSGSVEAAVTMLRRRNLAVGFGVLAVLAVTMALVMVNAQRARTLARLQMDFVAGISHELRTPLAVISSAAENLADGVVDNPRQQQRYGAIIRNHARQLTQLVEQVLLFASTSEGKQGLHLLPLEVKQVVENAVESTASTVSGAGFRLEVQVAPALPRVMADAAALAQCLQNLITNAVKYGGEARWIGLTAVSEADSAGAEVRITVADRGIGIAESEMSHIFEPFYRSPAVVGSQIHGSGLGLALTQRITQAMGGRVSLKSEVGRGSSFTLHLPAAPESVAAEEPAVASVPEVPKVPS
jgi:signal transduction histidine kinase